MREKKKAEEIETKNKKNEQNSTRLCRDDPLARPPPRPLLRRLAVPASQHRGEQRRLGAAADQPFVRSGGGGEGEGGVLCRRRLVAARTHRLCRRRRRSLRRLERVRPRRRLERHVRKVPFFMGRLEQRAPLHLALDGAAQVREGAGRRADLCGLALGVGLPRAGLVAEALELLDAGLVLGSPALEVALGLLLGEEFFFFFFF